MIAFSIWEQEERDALVISNAVIESIDENEALVIARPPQQHGLVTKIDIVSYKYNLNTYTYSLSKSITI